MIRMFSLNLSRVCWSDNMMLFHFFIQSITSNNNSSINTKTHPFKSAWKSNLLLTLTISLYTNPSNMASLNQITNFICKQKNIHWIHFHLKRSTEMHNTNAVLPYSTVVNVVRVVFMYICVESEQKRNETNLNNFGQIRTSYLIIGCRTVSGS